MNKYEKRLIGVTILAVTPYIILAAIAVFLLLKSNSASAMSQGGTVRMCQDLAALSRDVAQRRDEGFSPAAVMAIFAPSSDLEISTAERDPGVLREETELRETVMRVVSMTYSQPQYGPGEVHDTVYSTCLDRGRAYGLVP